MSVMRAPLFAPARFWLDVCRAPAVAASRVSRRLRRGRRTPSDDPGQEAETVVLAELRRSPFLDDLTPADRRVVPLLLTLPIGVIAALLAALICGLAVFVAFAITGGGVAS
jgi:hypothetical protein